MRGLTLLEILLAIAILSILVVFSIISYDGYTRNTELDFIAKDIKSDLKGVRGKAMNGQEGKDWGVHFNNGTNDLYEIFSGSTYVGGTVEGVVYLPGVITFSSPAEGNSKDIIFNNITGTANQDSITVSSGSNSVTITVSPEGNIN